MFTLFNLSRADTQLDYYLNKGVENLTQNDLDKILKIVDGLISDLPSGECSLKLKQHLEVSSKSSAIQKCVNVFFRQVLNKEKKDLALKALEIGQKILFFNQLISQFRKEEVDHEFKIDTLNSVMDKNIETAEKAKDLCLPILQGIEKEDLESEYKASTKKNFIFFALRQPEDVFEENIGLVRDISTAMGSYEFFTEVLENVEDLDEDELITLTTASTTFYEDLYDFCNLSEFFKIIANIPMEHIDFFVEKVVPICKNLPSARDRSKVLRIFLDRAKRGKSHLEQFCNFVEDLLEHFTSGDRKLEVLELLNNLNQQCWKCFEGYEKTVVDEIKGYRGEAISLGLLHKFCNGIINSSFLRNYQWMSFRKDSYIVHMVLPCLYPATWITKAAENIEESPDVLTIKEFVLGKRKEFRDVNNRLMSNFLLACESIDQSPLLQPKQKIKILSRICAYGQTAVSNQDIVGLISKIVFICRMGESATLNNSSENFDEFVSKIHHKIFRDKILGQSIIVEDSFKKYQDSFGNARVPACMEIYLSVVKILRNQAFSENLSRFVVSVLEGTFFTERYRTDNNEHLHFLEVISPVIFEKWKTLASEEPLPVDFLATHHNAVKIGLYNNWQDLFLAGTEVEGSCMRIDGNADYNKALLAYCLDGKNSIIAIKNKNNKILCRGVFRLLWNDEENIPVLLLETIYPKNINMELKLMLLRFALNKAKDCGLDLVVDPFFQVKFQTDMQFSPYKGRAVSYKGSCPFDYADSARGVVKDGGFEIDNLLKVDLSV